MKIHVKIIAVSILRLHVDYYEKYIQKLANDRCYKIFNLLKTRGFFEEILSL